MTKGTDLTVVDAGRETGIHILKSPECRIRSPHSDIAEKKDSVCPGRQKSPDGRKVPVAIGIIARQQFPAHINPRKLFPMVEYDSKKKKKQDEQRSHQTEPLVVFLEKNDHTAFRIIPCTSF